ncbi:SCO2195 family GlnR-regulated protein [Actinacidiphila oryziradicis]|uniref:Uncharacterized protein n=1 Tax=Actinacidiphila oryziradicis TaxID=2571141 RepID=A0A4U0SHP5_9ACTN|nr:hypothetical protein [Actinacidiphila oryziradicis]TKA08583.1 hypothetical protein FCI23_26995 [Actinacidiphila oryziradicis]
MPTEIAPHVQQITGALRVVESFLFRGAEQTARRNAWSAVLEDRKRAKDRREAQHVIDALAGAAASPGGKAGPESL